MRAGVVRQFGEAGQILVDNVPTPPIGDNQVLIKVKASSVNRVDLSIRSGNYSKLPQLPYITGKDGAGVVEQVSNGITQFKAGDRVFFVSSKNGANADYILADPNFVFHLPERVSFAQGATLGVAYFAAYRALFVGAHAQPGQTVFIHGASGGVGIAASQLAKIHGLRVYGTVGSEEGENLIREFVEKSWNHTQENYVENIQQEFPEGFDIVLEMVANVNLNKDINLVRKGGKIVIVGNRGNIEINPDHTIFKEAQIIGLYTDDTNVEEYQRIAERIVGLLGESHLTPVIGKTYPLEQLPDAQNQLENQPAQGKIVLVHDSDANEIAGGQQQGEQTEQSGEQPQQPGEQPEQPGEQPQQPEEGGEAPQPEVSAEQPQPE